VLLRGLVASEAEIRKRVMRFGLASEENCDNCACSWLMGFANRCSAVHHFQLQTLKFAKAQENAPHSRSMPSRHR
jgi:hypothetical protein